jgi:hypothetical protein
MKTVTLNFSGNTGKTTLSRWVLQPRIRDAQIISVESANSDGQEDIILKGKRFSQLMQAVSLMDSVIVDVGASNAEDFLWAMEQQLGSQEDFDFFFIPTVAASKQMADTVKTVEALAALGVDKHRIKVVLNHVSYDDILEDAFAPVYSHYRKQGNFTLVDRATIPSNELFPLLVRNKLTLEEVLADTTDFKAEILKEPDIGKKAAISDKMMVFRLARGIIPKLDAVFEALVA